MKIFNSKLMLAFALSGLIFTSCDSEDNPIDNPNVNPAEESASAFIISATVTGATGESANYLLTSDNLTEGELTTVGAGKETDPGTFWMYHKDKFLFRLVYNQGGAGLSSSYELGNEGRILDRDGQYEIRRFTTMGIHGDYLITTSTGALGSQNAETISGNNYIPRGFLVNDINMNNETIGTNTEERWAEDYFGNGEFVTFSGILEANSKIYTAPIPMGMSHYGVVVHEDKIRYPDLIKTESGGSGSGSYTAGELQWTQYPDEAYLAIYNDKTFSNPTLLKTDKISYAAGRQASQYYQMIWAAGNGDVYVFSPSYAKVMSDDRQKTTLPAGVMRVKAGATEFDPSYYVNIEEQSNGAGFLRSWHVSGDYFMLMMYDRPFSEAGYAATKLAVFKGDTGVLTYITGLPENISSFANTPYFESGKIFMPIMVTGQDPAIYVIDAATATATKGISVKANSISSVGKLSNQ